MKKLIKDIAGETIVETLVATLIVMLAVTMVAGAVVTSARINNSASGMDVGFTTVKDDGTTNLKDVPVTVKLKNATGTVSSSVTAQQTDDDNGYIFYDVASAG